MKTMTKKLASIVLALCLCFSLVGTALAAETKSTDTGSITINGLTEGVTATAYQIAKATYDSEGNFLGYEMTVSSDKTTWTIGSDGSWTNPTEADLAALFENVGEAAGTATANSEGVATFTDLPIGSYLIVISGSESVVYGMMIGSVSYTTEDNEWAIDNGSVSTNAADNLWAKATTPTISKTEHHTGGSGTHGESTSVGDEITFDITINNIPSYEGEYPVFDVDDTLTGLTISSDELNALTVTIMNGDETIATLVKDRDYTVTQISSSEFDVNFVINGAYTLNSYAGKGYSIVIEYQATVVDSAVYDDDELEHDNVATLTYSSSSYVYSTENPTIDDTDYEYDFEIEFTKIDGTKEEDVELAGATFGLYTDENCSIPYTRMVEGTATAVTAVSGEDGKVEFTGLNEGTYYVKEIEAPAGYILNQNVYTVTIVANYNTDGTIDNYTITISGTGYDAQNNTIANTPVDSAGLPSTGGMGTTIFYIIGGILVAGAVVVLITRRRMNHEA